MKKNTIKAVSQGTLGCMNNIFYNTLHTERVKLEWFFYVPFKAEMDAFHSDNAILLL